MESIKFYKLISPYAGDVTKNCKLNVADIDDNFLAFKNNDISGSTFDNETYTLSIVKNDGEEIKVDLSPIKEYIDNNIPSSGQTEPDEDSGTTSTNLNLALELLSGGTLVLSWDTESGRTETSVSGVGISNQTVYSDGITIYGNGEITNPFRLSNLSKITDYKNVKGVVSKLPNSGLSIGDKYITKELVKSEYGTLYSKQGLELIKQKLSEEGSLWRIPTKADWDTYLSNIETCDTDYSSECVDIEQGTVSGKLLKTVDYWDGNDNLDSYGFSILPTYYANGYKELVTSKQCAVFWTDSEYKDDSNFLKKFSYNRDNIEQIAALADDMYSIRLVMDYNASRQSFTPYVFGKSYDVIYATSVNQIWLKTNLDEDLENEDYSKKFTYGEEKDFYTYYINYWDGNSWEKKPLENGDDITISNDDINSEYELIELSDGSLSLVKTRDVSGNGIVYDAGWY